MDLHIVPFYIEIYFADKRYKLYVTHEVFESIEVFTCAAKNKTITVQSNRPLLRKNSLNKKKIKWSIINGQVGYQTFLEQIIQALESKIRSIERPPFDNKNHPKNNPY
jgi:hypothetical protein